MSWGTASAFVVAGLVPATPIILARCFTIRGRLDKPGDDAPVSVDAIKICPGIVCGMRQAAPLTVLPRLRGKVGQRDDDAHAGAAAVSRFNRKLAAERLNALLHAAKPETQRLPCRDAEAIVTHRQLEPCAFTSPRLRGEVTPFLPSPACGGGKG